MTAYMNDKVARYISYLWLLEMMSPDKHGGSELLHEIMEEVGASPDKYPIEPILSHIEAQREIVLNKLIAHKALMRKKGFLRSSESDES